MNVRETHQSVGAPYPIVFRSICRAASSLRVRSITESIQLFWMGMIDYDPPEINHPTQIRQALLEGGDINFYRLTIDPSRNGNSRSAAPNNDHSPLGAKCRPLSSHAIVRAIFSR